MKLGFTRSPGIVVHSFYKVFPDFENKIWFYDSGMHGPQMDTCVSQSIGLFDQNIDFVFVQRHSTFTYVFLPVLGDGTMKTISLRRPHMKNKKIVLLRYLVAMLK